MSELQTILVSHNSEEALPLCLESLPGTLRRQAVVVDNGSRDASAAVAGALGARVVETGENLGFARGANIGARAATGEVLCFLNPDCTPPEDLFSQAVAALSGPGPACAAPSLDEGGELIPGRQPGYTRTRVLADALETAWGTVAPVRWLRRRPGHDDTSWWWAHGACLFIRRTTFLELGGFDERYFLYMEDVDLGRRLCSAGGEVLQLEAVVPHRRSHGAQVDPVRRRTRLLEGRLLFARLSYGGPFAAALRAATWPARPLWRLRAGLARDGEPARNRGAP